MCAREAIRARSSIFQVDTFFFSFSFLFFLFSPTLDTRNMSNHKDAGRCILL